MIIFIHGMGHNPSREYWSGWAKNLRPHLIEQGVQARDLCFDGIYYYDLVPQPGDGWKKLISLFSRDFFEEMKEDVWQNMTREELLRLTKRGPLDALIDLVVDHFGDIFCYLLDDKTYVAVNQRVYQTLEQTGRPVTLVAYSLGSMVAFCALQRNKQIHPRIKHFITVGSPVFWFRRWIRRRADLGQKPLPAPWTNLAGRLDIACPHLLSLNCRPDAQVECLLDQYNPIKGHLAYIHHPQGLKTLARAVAGKKE
ncbi:hypothetical protein Desru_1199 [Desulforamulus ruminis DSM 2154]|uniref:AB hydrolase-1 domain-containing protein n=1 Tax=Desulforamulus ruminis (strain ATCC 23193 / DSM 2154 / NCIMB 8452 / DL) TaxID=696281 RepID=F6DN16_DESRL|nr:hypothetical protein Desru_1199 [Desulforamulus ruminis DSM 2154]